MNAADVKQLILSGLPGADVHVRTDDDTHFETVVVAAPARGRGLAALLMEEAMRVVGDHPARLDAQLGLAEWYAGFGFAATGPAFDEDGIMHLPMARPGWR